MKIVAFAEVVSLKAFESLTKMNLILCGGFIINSTASKLSKITHPEIYQFFSGLMSNTSLITSTTNFKTLLGIHQQLPYFFAFRYWMASGELTVKPSSSETHAK